MADEEARERDRLYERAEQLAASLAALGDDLRAAVADINAGAGAGPADAPPATPLAKAVRILNNQLQARSLQAMQDARQWRARHHLLSAMHILNSRCRSWVHKYMAVTDLLNLFGVKGDATVWSPAPLDRATSRDLQPVCRRSQSWTSASTRSPRAWTAWRARDELVQPGGRVHL